MIDRKELIATARELLTDLDDNGLTVDSRNRYMKAIACCALVAVDILNDEVKQGGALNTQDIRHPLEAIFRDNYLRPND